jgi:hypothetical protein
MLCEACADVKRRQRETAPPACPIVSPVGRRRRSSLPASNRRKPSPALRGTASLHACHLAETISMNTNLFRTLLSLLALLVSWPASAAEEQLADFVRAQGEFEAALRGDSSALTQANAAFKNLLVQDPGNPLFLAYYGSTFALQARHAWMPWNKLKLAEEGLDYIDKGLGRLRPEHDAQTLRGAPVSVETKLVAVSTFFQVPDNFLHRFAPGERLLADTLKAPSYAASPPSLQARLQFQVAVAARHDERRDDEIAGLRRCLALDPGSTDAVAARSRLKELGQ